MGACGTWLKEGIWVIEGYSGAWQERVKERGLVTYGKEVIGCDVPDLLGYCGLGLGWVRVRGVLRYLARGGG